MSKFVQMVFGAVAAGGNMVILVAFGRDAKLIKREGLFALLACIDMLFGGAIALRNAADLLTDATTVLSRTMCLLWAFPFCISMASQSVLCSLAFDRISVLRRPFAAFKRTWADNRRILIRTALLAVGVFAALTMFMTAGFLRQNRHDNATLFDETPKSTCAAVTLIGPSFFLVIVLSSAVMGLSIVVLNGVVFYQLRKTALNLAAKRNTLSKGQRENVELYLKNSQLVLYIMGLFLATWVMPLVIFFGLRVLHALSITYPETMDYLLEVIVRSQSTVIPAANILLYTLKHRGIRRSVFQLIGISTVN